MRVMYVACRRVVSLHRFEHFDVNSMVVKSIDHGEMLSIGSFVCLFVTITFTVFDGQFAPPSFHFQELYFYRPISAREVAQL